MKALFAVISAVPSAPNDLHPNFRTCDGLSRYGYPINYRRWIADGLKLELERSGFAVMSLYRLKSGPRAVLFWMNQLAQAVTLPTGRLQRLTMRVLRKLYVLNRAKIDGFIDRSLASYTVRSESAEDAINFSVGLLASAEKSIAAAADRAR